MLTRCKNWSTSDLVIVKTKRVNIFLKHSVGPNFLTQPDSTQYQQTQPNATHEFQNGHDPTGPDPRVYILYLNGG